MKQVYILFSVFAIVLTSNAQNIAGKIFNANTKEALSGATISNGTNQAVSTADGSFSINCSNTKNLAISFVGYATRNYTIKSCNEKLSIELVPTSAMLDVVELSATSNNNKSLLYQPASISKLTTRELKRGNGLFLDDAINTNVPGVTMQRRTVSAGQQFNIRGYGNGVRGTNGPNSNFDGQGSKVYLNGIPITDAEGITLMDDIDFGTIDNVEVIKGPAGSLYGLAIAGVVNLKTIKAAKGKNAVSQEFLIGDYGLQRYNTRLQLAGEKSSLLINYGKQKCDGFMNHTNSDKTFITAIGDIQPNEKQSISYYAGYSNSYDQRGGELTIAQYNNFDYSGNPAYIKNDAHSNIISVRGGVGHIYKLNSHFSNNTSVFASGVSNNVSSAGGWTDKAPVNYGLRSTLDAKFSFKKGITLNGITGIETQHQYAQLIAYNMVKNPLDSTLNNVIGSMRSNQNIVTRTTSLFSEWTLGLPKDFTITGGVGMSNMEITMNDRMYVANSTKPTYFTNNYNGLISPHVAINKVFNKGVSVYASYSKGYKAPVSSYFYIPYTGAVNTNLKSEIGNQFEVGSKGSLLKDKLYYEIALFQTKFTNKMTAVSVPNSNNTATLYSYIINGGGQKNQGIELLVKYTAYKSDNGFVNNVRAFANLAYSDFKYENFKFQKSISVIEDYSGKAVAGVAKYTANIGADIAMKHGLYANITYSYKDGMPISSDGLNNTTSYNLLNGKIGINRSLSKQFDLDAYVGVNNITGVQYYYMVFANQLPDAYMPAPFKANYFGGVSLKYNF